MKKLKEIIKNIRHKLVNKKSEVPDWVPLMTPEIANLHTQNLQDLSQTRSEIDLKFAAVGLGRLAEAEKTQRELLQRAEQSHLFQKQQMANQKAHLKRQSEDQEDINKYGKKLNRI